MEVNRITIKSQVSGVSRYEQETLGRIEEVKFNLIEYKPPELKIRIAPLILKIFKKFFLFPFQVIRAQKKGVINHITYEGLAYLLNFIKLKNSVVTCHSLIPIAYDKTRSLYWALNMRGLKKADRIITVSDFSKSEIVKYLKYPGDRIDVVPDAVDHDRYYPKRSKEILKKYGIPEDQKIILYVGSEQPRQNVPFIFKAIAILKKDIPKVKLVKIGTPQWPKARRELEKLKDKLGLKNNIVFTDYVDEDELPKWYNAADLFIYPCLYAGFGVPPLEAMACGTPVITSNLTSLPEVVAGAAIAINPHNIDGFTQAMKDILTNNYLSSDLAKRGIERAELFSWEESAKKILEIYKKINI